MPHRGPVSVVVPGVLLLVAGLAVAVLQFWPRAHTRVVSYPDHVLAEGGTGSQTWTVVANATKVSDDPPQGCMELRDGNGTPGAGGCGYRLDDRSRHELDYLVGELPGDQGQVWFGPAPDTVATVEFRFPAEPPRRVVTIAVRGLPGRFFVLFHRIHGDPSDPASFPGIVATDAAGRTVVV